MSTLLSVSSRHSMASSKLTNSLPHWCFVSMVANLVKSIGRISASGSFVMALTIVHSNECKSLPPVILMFKCVAILSSAILSTS